MRAERAMGKGIMMALVASLLSGCMDIGCDDDVRLRVASPDGRHEAVVFGRDCGATTGLNTQVAIVPLGEAPEGAGNTLVMDDIVQLHVRWTSGTALYISGVSGKVYHQSNRVGEVSVSYPR